MRRSFKHFKPKVHSTAYVHDSAELIGRVELRRDAWSVAACRPRGDIEPIVIGEGSNVQDATVMHTSHGIPVVLGKGVTIGHGAIVHGARIGDFSLIGMGAILLDGCVIGKECLVGAGTLVSENTKVHPVRSCWAFRDASSARSPPKNWHSCTSVRKIMSAMPKRIASTPVHSLYKTLYKRYGPQHWWPAKTRWEMMVGALLTQNTSWTNVEMAIRALRKAKSLTPEAIQHMPLRTLQKFIRPSGYFRQKAVRLKHLAKVYRRVPAIIKDRERLLALPGIGPETADSILLYAGRQPAFVVDAYTPDWPADGLVSRQRLSSGAGLFRGATAAPRPTV